MHNRDGNTHVHHGGSKLLNEEQLIEGINKILEEEAERKERTLLISYRGSLVARSES